MEAMKGGSKVLLLIGFELLECDQVLRDSLFLRWGQGSPALEVLADPLLLRLRPGFEVPQPVPQLLLLGIGEILEARRLAGWGLFALREGWPSAQQRRSQQRQTQRVRRLHSHG